MLVSVFIDVFLTSTVRTVRDPDLSSILLLLHLIPPSAQGRQRPGKVSASQAEKHLVVLKKVCFWFFFRCNFLLFNISVMVLYNLLCLLRVEQTFRSVFKTSLLVLSPISWLWDLRRIQFFIVLHSMQVNLFSWCL